MWRLCLIRSESYSTATANKPGLSESNNKTIWVFQAISSAVQGQVLRTHLGPGCSFCGKREKQGWVRESWETVVEDWACLSSCHPGEIGVTQHHLNPASPMSVSLTVQSSSIKNPLETAVLLPWQRTVPHSYQLCQFPKLVLGTLDLLPMTVFSHTQARYPVSWGVNHLLFAFSMPLKAQCANELSSCRPSPTRDPVLWNQMEEIDLKWKFTLEEKRKKKRVLTKTCL